MKQTQATKISEVKRAWNFVNLKDKTLGRVATEIAGLLMGKGKPYFVKNLDCGDFVVATNAKDISVTGKKELLKTYTRHSGYPQGLKVETLGKLRKRNPTEIISHAVFGMLPDNRLRAQMMKRLFIFVDEDHPYKEKVK